MKKLIFSLLFLSSLSVFGQETWNTCSQTVTVIPQPSYDSTFVLSAPSRAALAKGMASWTPATSSGASYLVYTALLTQTGTDAPVATVLENTLGGTVVWSYNDVGKYIATLSNAFTANKTAVFCNLGIDISTPFVGRMAAYRTSTNTIQVNVFDPINEAGFDDVLGDNYTSVIEIRVYP